MQVDGSFPKKLEDLADNKGRMQRGEGCPRTRLLCLRVGFLLCIVDFVASLETTLNFSTLIVAFAHTKKHY